MKTFVVAICVLSFSQIMARRNNYVKKCQEAQRDGDKGAQRACRRINQRFASDCLHGLFKQTSHQNIYACAEIKNRYASKCVERQGRHAPSFDIQECAPMRSLRQVICVESLPFGGTSREIRDCIKENR